MTPVRLEPAASRSRVKHSTTEPLRSLSLALETLIRYYPYCQKSTFEQQSMVKHRGNYVLKAVTIKEKKMLLIGSIFFPLKVDPMRIDNSFKEY